MANKIFWFSPVQVPNQAQVLACWTVVSVVKRYWDFYGQLRITHIEELIFMTSTGQQIRIRLSIAL